MYYTGFADEAGDGMNVQIQATKELGWSNIESRNINGINLTDLSDAAFEVVHGKLTEAGVAVSCFGSTIANWSKDPRSELDFQTSIDALKRAIPRMHRLGTKILRGMSFGVVKDEAPDSPELEKIIFKKVQHLVKMCEETGIIYAHENCMNYGGMSHEHTLKLVEHVNSPYFKLVFDTGNPVFTYRRIGTEPYVKQSSWEFYSQVKEFVHHVHIKDAKYIAEADGIFPEVEHTFPGDGHGDVEKIVKDLLKSGYDGAFSIEPHLAVVFHDDSVKFENQVKYDNYVEYGRRFMKLVQKIQEELNSD